MEWNPSWPGHCLLAALLLVLALPVQAGWSEDPALNTPVAEGPGDFIQPKIALRPDGYSYVSWFQNTGSGYDVYLQYLNPEGEIQWEEEGSLVAQRSFSSTEEYGLDVDAAGYAVLAFRDDRFDGLQITASRIAPDGTPVWGSEGVALTDGEGFVAAPRIIGASDGSIVAAWYEDGNAGLAGLAPDGTIQWTDAVSDGTGLGISDLRASDAPGESGQVIALMATLAGFMEPRYLYAQKYDGQGARLWGDSPVQLFDSGSLQLGNFPEFRPDGEGGMAVAWYQSQPALQSYVQWLDSDGEPRFDQGGLEVSTQASQLRTDPAVTVGPNGQELFVFWRETDSLQNQIGLYGQAVSEAGERLWSDAGIAFIPLGDSGDITQVRVALMDGKPLVSAVTGNGTLEALGVDTDGAPFWTPARTLVSDTPATPSRSQLQVHNEPPAGLFVWNDDRNGANDIFIQRLRADGTLGGDDSSGGIFADRFEFHPPPPPDGD